MVSDSSRRAGGRHRFPREVTRRRRLLRSAAQLCALILIGLNGCNPRLTSAAPHQRYGGSGAAEQSGVVTGGVVAGPVPGAKVHGPAVAWQIPPRRVGGIEGFSDRVSVRPGDFFRLYVSTRAPSFRVRALRLGDYPPTGAALQWTSSQISGEVQARPRVRLPDTETVEAPWHPSLIVSTQDWPPGVYLLRLEASTGGMSFVPLSVRAPSAAGRVVLISPVTTWQAYNLWGCCDLYQGKDGSYATRSRAVTFDRPYLNQQGTGDFLFSELGVVELAERMHLPLDYITDVELEADPTVLDGARAVVSMGHDEYWSQQMRATLSSALSHGTNLAFLGANAIFRRIRFADSPLGPNRIVINYKEPREDPLLGTDDAAVTANWPTSPDPRPESRLLGAQYGCYLGPDVLTKAVVTSSKSWLLAGAGVHAGQELPGLLGPEVDAVQPAQFPTPRPIEVLLHSPVGCPADQSQYADSSYYVAKSGAGVFDAGTIAWVCAVEDTCGTGRMTAVTKNVARRITTTLLRAFARGPAGSTHPAHDNLAQLGITRS